MKIKIMLSIGLLVSAVSPDLQAMDGVQNFVCKLFLSKTAAFTAALVCINRAMLYNNREYFVKKSCKDPRFSLEVEEKIKDVFAPDGIDINILQHSDRSMPVSGLRHSGKSMLLLSDEVVAILSSDEVVAILTNDKGKSSDELMGKGLPDTITKDEIFSVMEHEKSHLKDYDQVKRELLGMTFFPFMILSMKAARLCGRGMVVTGVIGLAQLYLVALFHSAFIRQQEKKADLSLSTSKAALSLASYFEKLHSFEEKKLEVVNSGLPDGFKAVSSSSQFSFFNQHPPHLERAHYLRVRADCLEKKEKAAEEYNKK